jgi:hypothetical protein
MPPFDPLPSSFGLSFSLSLPQGLCGSAVLFCPGGGPPFVGHGGRTLTAAGFAVRTAGSGVDRGVGRGVGRAVGFGVAGGLGVAADVGRAVGAAVGRAVGALVGAAVGAEVGAAVAPPVGAAVGCVAGCCVPVGSGVEPGARPGGAEARPVVGDGDGSPGGEASGPEGVGSGADGDPEGAGWPGWLGWPLPPVGCVPGCDVPGVGVFTMATGGWPDAASRCWSPTPPTPNAIVARTRFRTPRLRMSRAR